MKFKKLPNIGKDESGATAIEYGLIAALIAVAIIGTMSAVGNELNNNYFGDIGSNLGNVNTPTP